jgi:hypothetical protein
VRDAAAGYEEGSAFWKLGKVKVTRHGRVWARRRVGADEGERDLKAKL